MIVLNGKEFLKKEQERLKKSISKVKADTGSSRNPKLVVFQYGNRGDSNSYIAIKSAACKETGIDFELRKVPLGTGIVKFAEMVNAVSVADGVDGVIVQLPLDGEHSPLQENLVISKIDNMLDVDKLTRESKSRFYVEGRLSDSPCTPMGVVKLLQSYNINFAYRKICIIGRSDLVGKPLAKLLLDMNATVSVCHSYTSLATLYDEIDNSDIVISCVGKAGLINESLFGTIDFSNKTLVDVGIVRTQDGLKGDIEENIKSRSFAATPVPGGVGPATVASLLNGVVVRYEINERISSAYEEDKHNG